MFNMGLVSWPEWLGSSKYIFGHMNLLRVTGIGFIDIFSFLFGLENHINLKYIG